MHLCPDEIIAISALLAAGIGTVFRYVRHKVGCACRWCFQRVQKLLPGG